ncbi:MAG TPA: FAD-binding oxidoreductase [Hyphomicrobiaceae bacterium]|nr:FAD-binding oxidoreductase [Hyphomicrobiaceae bacterium]
MQADVLVLGAGMVGVSAALHLQRRGLSVILVDRRPPAEETSHGNAGLIQSEAAVPYSFPRDPVKIVRYAFNLAPEARIDWRALPALAPWLISYWRHGAPDRVDHTARAMRPLVERSVEEHEVLMREAGIAEALRRTGYLRIFRSERHLEQELAAEEIARARYGVISEAKTPAEIGKIEPHLAGALAGGILMPEPASVADPGAVGKAYASLLERHGGRFVIADARTLEQERTAWRISHDGGIVRAGQVVIALGAWSGDVLRPLGIDAPLAVKRGYHMHYAASADAVLHRPVYDGDYGYVLAPMRRGLRLTTGAEFALREAPPSPVQLARVEPAARALFPLGRRLDDKPWLGFRPCLPDLLPVIGPAPRHQGLWLDFGHHHLGFTLGPVSGRLLADLMTRNEPFTDPAPYHIVRFG